MNKEQASECGRAVDHITDDIVKNAEILSGSGLTQDLRSSILEWIASQVKARSAISENLNKYTSSIE